MNNNSEYMGVHILLLEGYARQSLPFMKEFRKLGCVISILCNSKLDCGYSSRLPHNKILGICDRDDYERSEEYIINLIKKSNFDVIFPLGDFSARILSENKVELSKYTKVASNDKEAFLKSYDKLNVMKVCMENKIPCPYTLINIKDKTNDLLKEIKYPIIIKPRNECGGRGFNKFYSEKEFFDFINHNNIDLSKNVIQEMIPIESDLISEQLFIDNSGAIKSYFQYKSERFYPVKGGTGTLNKLVYIPAVHENSMKIIKLFDLKGCVGIDYMIDTRDGMAKVIEINPRAIACVKIGFDSGVNIALQLLQKEFCKDVTAYETIMKDLRIRMTQVDILWFLKSKNRFKCKPSWFDFRNTKDQMFSISDPLPWFSFLIQGLKTYKNRKGD